MLAILVLLPAGAPAHATRSASGITVAGTAPTAIDELNRRIRVAAQRDAGYTFGPDVVRSFSAGLPIAVEHRYGTGGRISRRWDSAPFRGGASITIDTDVCTSGFTVKSPEGDRYLLTAGHCGHRPGVPSTIQKLGRPPLARPLTWAKTGPSACFE